MPKYALGAALSPARQAGDPGLYDVEIATSRKGRKSVAVGPWAQPMRQATGLGADRATVNHVQLVETRQDPNYPSVWYTRYVLRVQQDGPRPLSSVLDGIAEGAWRAGLEHRGALVNVVRVTDVGPLGRAAPPSAPLPAPAPTWSGPPSPLAPEQHPRNYVEARPPAPTSSSSGGGAALLAVGVGLVVGVATARAARE